MRTQSRRLCPPEVLPVRSQRVTRAKYFAHRGALRVNTAALGGAQYFLVLNDAGAGCESCVCSCGEAQCGERRRTFFAGNCTLLPRSSPTCVKLPGDAANGLRTDDPRQSSSEGKSSSRRFNSIARLVRTPTRSVGFWPSSRMTRWNRCRTKSRAYGLNVDVVAPDCSAIPRFG